jgi:Transcriptional regulator
MNQTQVECFLTIVEEKNYSKAAERLFLSQPTLSRYIQALEKELGCVLFNRTTKKVELTEDGRQYQELFLRWTMELRNLKEKLSNDLEEKQSKVRIGIIEDWYTRSFFTKFYDHITSSLPEISLEIVCYGINELLKKLESGDLDMVLSVGNSKSKEKRFFSKVIYRSNKVILYAEDHPLANKKDLKVEDFKNEIFYAVPDDEGNDAEESIRQWCGSYHFIPIIRHLPNLQSIYANIRNGNGVMINEDLEDYEKDGPIRALPMKDKGEVCLICRREHENKAAYKIFELFDEEGLNR